MLTFSYPEPIPTQGSSEALPADASAPGRRTRSVLGEQLTSEQQVVVFDPANPYEK